MELITRGSSEVTITWQFDFGDGTQVETTEIQDFNHTYASPGTYTVTLTVWQFFCMARQTQKVIEIFPVDPKFQAVQECQPLRMDFVNTTVRPQPADSMELELRRQQRSKQRKKSNAYIRPSWYLHRDAYHYLVVRQLYRCVSSGRSRAPFTISLGNDTTFCYGRLLTLSTDQPADTYQWSTGQVSPTISISAPGIYWVEAKRGNCTVADTVKRCLSWLPSV